jgi:CheY-like chemotaxis protein
MLIQGWLDELGHQAVGPASSESAGFQLMQENELDVALLDVGLGNGNSYRLAEALIAREIPVVFATGISGVDRKYDAAPKLSKPFTLASLKAALDQAVGQH